MKLITEYDYPLNYLKHSFCKNVSTEFIRVSDFVLSYSKVTDVAYLHAISELVGKTDQSIFSGLVSHTDYNKSTPHL